MTEAQPRIIQRYIAPDSKIPFDEWLTSLRDDKARVRIRSRLRRVELGNLGDWKSVGAGVFEFRIDYGSGYRVYFGQIGTDVILLLCGGDKSNQEQDIKKAREYWADYEQRENTNQ